MSIWIEEGLPRLDLSLLCRQGLPSALPRILEGDTVMLNGGRWLSLEAHDGCDYVMPKLMTEGGRPGRLCLCGANHQLARVFEMILRELLGDCHQ